MRIRPKEPSDQEWIEAMLKQQWGSCDIIVHGQKFDADKLPALVADDHTGLLTYEIKPDGTHAEIITLNALAPGQKTGTALVNALVTMFAERGVRFLQVTMTNDNLDALRFYQRRGFRLTALRPGAVNEARMLKPSIPTIGKYGIPMRDEVELCLEISG